MDLALCCPGRHLGLCDSSWGLVLSASGVQPVSDVTSPSWLGTGTPFCCRLCLTGPSSGCHLGKQQAGREGERGKQINALCSPPPAPPYVHLTLLQGAPQLFLPFPELRATQAPPNPSTPWDSQSCPVQGQELSDPSNSGYSMVPYLSTPFPHTFLGLIQFLGINVLHGTVLPPDVQTRAQQHSCSTPLLHHRSSGQAADAGMMNRGFSLAAAGSLPPARLPGPARCAKNQCHEAQGRPGSSWREDGHELWMCWPTLGAEGTSLHRNHGLCPTDLTDTRLDKSTLCSLNTAPWGHSQEGAVLPRSPGCGEARGAVETCGRGEAHQGSCSWNSCPHIQELARGGSPAVGRLFSASGTQRSFGSHRPAAPRDALVLSLHHPCHGWCCPEPAPPSLSNFPVPFTHPWQELADGLCASQRLHVLLRIPSNPGHQWQGQQTLACSRLGRDTTGQGDTREELQNHLLKQNQ